MFWLLRKLFGIGVFAAVLFFALQFPVGGRPLREYLLDFYRAPIVQEGIRQGRDQVMKYLQKDVGMSPEKGGPAMEKLSDQEREELEKVLQKETRD